MNPKTIRWSLIVLFAVLFSLQLAWAIGIRPAKTTMISDESKDFSGQFWVVNNEQRQFAATITVDGEMARYVTLHTTELHFRDDDEALPVDFEVHLPGTVPPGTSTANIVIEESLEDAGPNTISSKMVLNHKIVVQGPYPDKYINAQLNFHDQGDTIEFVSEVQNLGKQDIQEVKTAFYVNDKKQEPHLLETEPTSLKTEENKLLKATLDKDFFERGEFEVSAVTTYDDQKAELVRTLVVGKPDIDITYFDNYFVANKINQYTMDLLNQWNKEIKHVFVEVEVQKDSQIVDEFKTKSVDIPGSMMERIQDYFDARQKNPGKYGFDLKVNFWNIGRMDQKKYHYDSELMTNEEYNAVGAAASPGKDTQRPDSGSSLTTMLFWILAGSILGAVALFVLWRYLHRDEYEDGDKGL